MKSLFRTSLMVALAICPMATFAADRQVDPADEDLVPLAGTNYSKEVSCGGSITLLTNAPKGTAVSLVAESCTCKPTAIVLNVMQGDSTKDLCSLQPSEDCLRDIPEGADVIVGVTADPGGTCKVSGRISP